MHDERKTRRAQRLKHRVRARFQGKDQEQTGFVINLSEVGLFIQTRHLLKTGSEVAIHLDSEGGDQLEIKGKVAYSRKALPMAMGDPGGIGIALSEPSKAYLEFISRLKA